MPDDLALDPLALARVLRDMASYADTNGIPAFAESLTAIDFKRLREAAAALEAKVADREALVSAVGWARVDQATDEGIADYLFASGAIRKMPTREELAERFGADDRFRKAFTKHGAWVFDAPRHFADAVLALIGGQT